MPPDWYNWRKKMENDYDSMLKKDLVKKVKEFDAEIKALNKRLANFQSHKTDKPFTAVSVVEVDKIPSVVTVQFNIEEAAQVTPYKQGVHMADHQAKICLLRDIIQGRFKHETKGEA